jgi:protoporphyrinogen oxidase
MKIAVVGAGIMGLGAAWVAGKHHESAWLLTGQSQP